METVQLVHQQDLVIDRDSSNLTVGVYDCDGEFLWSFDSTWMDDQIREAVRFANNTFNKGYAVGKRMELARVQAALGIPELLRSTDDRTAP